MPHPEMVPVVREKNQVTSRSVGELRLVFDSDRAFSLSGRDGESSLA
jgi:hypothetical protein